MVIGTVWEEKLYRQLQELLKTLKYYGYSYGEILRSIYALGRADNDGKELIRCLLAYYTSHMTEMYYSYIHWSKDQHIDRLNHYRQELIEILNGSFLGSWANKMLPKVRTQFHDCDIGCRKNVQMRKVFILDFDDEVKRGLDNWVAYGSSITKHIKEYFHDAIVLSMFFDQPNYKEKLSFQWKLTKAPGKVSVIDPAFAAPNRIEGSGIAFFNL